MTTKKLVAMFAIIVIIASGLSLAQYLNSRGLGTLRTVIVPGDAKTLLDGKQIAANKDIRVAPGNHTISVSRFGFTGQAQTLEVKKGQVTTITIFLSANSEEGRQWQKTHPQQMAQAEGYYSRQFDQDSQNAVKQLPLLQYLPYIDVDYRIDYGQSVKNPNDASAVAITVKYWTEAGKTKALNWIRSKGTNPDKLEIIYTPASGF